MITSVRLIASHVLLSCAALSTSAAAQAPCNEWSTRFGVPGPHGTVLAQAVFDDGSGPEVYVGGNFRLAGSAAAVNVARWNGERWEGVGGGLDVPSNTLLARVDALAVWDDGTGPALYAGGVFNTAAQGPISNIARWNGTAWSPLGLGTDDEVKALAVFDDGSGPALYAGGFFQTAGSAAALHIARWNGTRWSTLGSGISDLPGGGAGNVFALAVHDDGSGAALYAGGAFALAGGSPASNLARWNGTSWSPVGSGTNGPVLAFQAFDAGGGPRLYVGGGFLAPSTGIAAWDGASLNPLGPPVLTSFVRCMTVFDAGAGARLYVGLSSSLRIWDGTGWSTPAFPPPFAPNSLAVLDVGGGPALHAAGVNQQTIGAVVGPSVVRSSGGAWSALSQLDSHGLESARALEVFDDGNGPALYADGARRWDGREWSEIQPAVVAGGLVTALETFDDGSGPKLCAAVSLSSPLAGQVRRLIGTTWSILGNPFTDQVRALASANVGGTPMLVAGGLFLTQFSHVAQWNGTSWQPLNLGTTGAVEALAFYDDGTGLALYAGGRFTVAGGVPASHIAKWNGSIWSALGLGLGGTGQVTVLAMAVHDDGSGPALYVTGRFASAGGSPATNIARWNGSTWSALGSGLSDASGIAGSGNALCVHDDGSGPALFVGGIFEHAGGVNVRQVAKWQGGAWLPLGRGTNGVVSALASYDDSSGGGADLFVGGSFNTAGNRISLGIAEWSDCSQWATPFCSGDGSSGACPCGNTGAARHGCASSSFAAGAALEARGAAHVSGDTLRLSATSMSGSSCIFFAGNLTTEPVLFGDGLRCVGGTLIRFGIEPVVLGASSYPQVGDLSVSSVTALPASGGTRSVQVFYRDASAGFCTAATSNATNAVAITFTP